MLSIWKEYGYLENPFNPNYLRINAEDYRLFIGRNEESKQFLANISLSKGGTLIVEGNIGVGKTSFVNIQQYKCWKHSSSNRTPKLLPSFQVLQFDKNNSTTTFMLSLLSIIIFSLIKTHSEKKVRSNPVCNEILQFISTSIQTSIGYQGIFMGIGGGRNIAKQTTQPASVLMPDVIHKLTLLLDEVKNTFKFDGVVVTIDNVDTADEHFIVGFLNQLRDITLAREKLWLILIGQKGLFSLLETRARRVSEIIIGEPVILNPLSLYDIKKAIQARIIKFRLKNSPFSSPRPVSSEVIALLYEVSNGEIRYIFKRATDLIVNLRLKYPTVRSVTMGIATNLLKQMATSKLQEMRLNKKDYKILTEMVEVREFRSKDYRDFNFNSAQAFNKSLKKYKALELINKSEEVRKGRKVIIYRTRGDLNLAIGL